MSISDLPNDEVTTGYIVEQGSLPLLGTYVRLDSPDSPLPASSPAKAAVY